MSVDVTVSTEITRPCAEVWRYITTVENDPVWTSGLIEARPLDGGTLQEGSRIERVSRFLGRRMVYLIEVRAVEEGRRVEMQTQSGPFPMKVVYELEALAEDRSRFTIRTSGDPGGFFALAAPLVSRAVKRQIGLDLATLKDVLEEGAGQ